MHERKCGDECVDKRSERACGGERGDEHAFVCAPAPARPTRRRANAGAAAAAALALWTGQARAEDRFAFDTPEGWSVEEKRDGETLAVAEDGARALRVVVERAQWPEALEAVARRARDEAVTAEDVARAITAPFAGEGSDFVLADARTVCVPSTGGAAGTSTGYVYEFAASSCVPSSCLRYRRAGVTVLSPSNRMMLTLRVSSDGRTDRWDGTVVRRLLASFRVPRGGVSAPELYATL